MSNRMRRAEFFFIKPIGVYNSGTDYCDTVSTYDEHTGEIHWPVTGAGSQRLVRCPYSYDNPSYASYDCLMLSDGNYTACLLYTSDAADE